MDLDGLAQRLLSCPCRLRDVRRERRHRKRAADHRALTLASPPTAGGNGEAEHSRIHPELGGELIAESATHQCTECACTAIGDLVLWVSRAADEVARRPAGRRGELSQGVECGWI